MSASKEFFEGYSNIFLVILFYICFLFFLKKKTVAKWREKCDPKKLCEELNIDFNDDVFEELDNERY